MFCKRTKVRGIRMQNVGVRLNGKQSDRIALVNYPNQSAKNRRKQYRNLVYTKTLDHVEDAL